MYSRLVVFPLLVMVACIGVYVWAQDNSPANGPQPPSLENLPRLLPPPIPPPPPQLTPPSTPPPSTPPETSATAKLPLIGGLAFQEALAIIKRHEQELVNLPGADGYNYDSEGIIVYTDDPAIVPAEVEGIPVRTAAALGWKKAEDTSKPEKKPEPPLKRECGPYAHWNPETGRCYRHSLPPDSGLSLPRPPLLPPPSGVIVLRPGKVREQAESCPSGFEERVEAGGWRFCVDTAKPEPIPPLMEPPIAGISREEAVEILQRHQEELIKLPGVESVGLGPDAIYIRTTNPAELPSEVEGVPIKPLPSRPVRMLNHTEGPPPIRPLKGAVAISDPTFLIPAPPPLSPRACYALCTISITTRLG
jgi:hypothetical protein